MGIYSELADFDHDHSLLDHVVYANDFNTSTQEGLEAFNNTIYTHHQNTDVIEETASCSCGKITEADKLNVICDVCATPVTYVSSSPIVPSLWLRAPKGIKGLIIPDFWIMLSKYLTTREIDFLRYLTDTSCKIKSEQITSKETKKKFDRLNAKNPPRGLNNFIEHFDEVFQIILDCGFINVEKRELIQFVEENRNKLFPQHLPFPSKLFFVVESTTSGIYIDDPTAPAIDAALTFANIENAPIPFKPEKLQNTVALALQHLANFHEQYDKDRLEPKPGLVRRHVLGGRLNLTGRAVITSLSEPHIFDELHIPWGTACQLLKYHLANILTNRHGMTAKEALGYIYEHVLKYSPLLDQLFKELINKSKYRGLVCSLHRNPTLQRGSTQRFRITKVKTELLDNSYSMSVIVLKGPNADFDGDQLVS